MGSIQGDDHRRCRRGSLASLGYAGYQLYVARRGRGRDGFAGFANSPQEYQQVIDRYPGSGPAASAYLLLAAQQRRKDYADANVTLHNSSTNIRNTN